jgi:diaminopimelate decarboxylase
MRREGGKVTWEPPFIQPHKIGALNKFGHGGQRHDRKTSEVFGVSVESLIRQYGSPLFVTSEQKLRNNIRRTKQAFERRYPSVIHGWSYKTNYTSAICNILHQEGSWAEVVSQFEYEKARALGVPGKRILFNGPNKNRMILERAIRDGAHIHVDHLDELKMIESIAEDRDIIVPVTLRLNFDTGYSEPWNRFGFNIESGQAREAWKFISFSSHLNLTGLHSHIGTFILEPRAYGEQVKIMCKFMRELESEGACIDMLDIGGGLPSRNALQTSYLPPDQAVPDIHEYAEAICNALMEGTRYRAQQGRDLPQLVFESGRAIVDDAQNLICTVVGTKRLPDGRRAAILNAGVNILFTAYWYNHQIKMTRDPIGLEENTVLYGPLCMNIDVVRHSIYLPPLVVGDNLIISPVGAYNNTQWQQFIEYRPNVVLVHESGDCSVIRSAENLETMMAHDQLPQHLVHPFLAPVETPHDPNDTERRKIRG